MVGEKNVLNLLRRIVQDSPADETEALLLTEDSSLTRISHSTVHQHMAQKNRSVVLRVVLGKRVAVATTNLLRPADLKTFLHKALALARAQQPNPEFTSLPPAQPVPPAETFWPQMARLTPAREIRFIREIAGMAQEKGLTISGAFSHGLVEVGLVNSRGLEAYQPYSDLFLNLIMEGEMGSGYAGFVTREPQRLNAASLAAEGSARVAREEPAEVEPGEYEVVLEPYAVRELLVFLGYLGFHALAVQEGRSFFCGRLGEKMVDEKITIYDDGFDPDGLPVPFDFEGTPKQRVVFFEEGVARGVTYDTFTAGREGKHSTGHALMAPNTQGPIPLNLFMKGGETSVAEMIRSVRKGIYVTRFHYTNVVEPMKAVITGMTRDGTFLIEGGEITRPLKNLRFTQSILQALSRVSAVSTQRKICSEGTVYSRRFITGTVVPAIKVDGFYFSGVSSL